MSFVVDYAGVDRNRPPDLAAFKAAGGEGVILRATWGAFVDDVLRRDRDAVEAAGLTLGAYAYVRAPKPGSVVPAPRSQIRAAAAAVGQLHRHDLPLTIDVEEDGSVLSPTDLHAWYREAWDEVADIYGVAPIEYTSWRYQHEVLHDIPPGVMDQSPLWLARYVVKEHSPAILDQDNFAAPPTPWGDHDNSWLHQTQGDARRIPGISNQADVDVFRVLRAGARGDRVRWVQSRLPGCGVDGAFGNLTATAVAAFQQREGIAVTRSVTLPTFARLCWSGAERL